MPLTQLDGVTALVIIDLQKGVAAMAPQVAGDVISRSARLGETGSTDDVLRLLNAR